VLRRSPFLLFPLGRSRRRRGVHIRRQCLQLLANFGWSAVNLVVYPPVLLGLTVLALASFARRRRTRLQAVSEFPDPLI